MSSAPVLLRRYARDNRNPKRSWLRWQFLMPRLLLVVVVLLAAQFTLGLAARRIAVRSLESAGAYLDIKHARVSLLDRQLVLGKVSVDHPQRPGETMVEADRCELDVAVGPLLRKQTVIDRGRVVGLRLAFTAPDQSATSVLFNDNSADLAAAWLAQLHERFERDLVSQLQSVQQCEKLCTGVATEREAFRERVQKLHDRSAKLQRASDAAQANPLRHENFLVNLPETTDELQRELDAVAAEFHKLPGMLEAERRTIVAARRADEQLAREALRFESIDAKVLTDYLLHEQAAAQLAELMGWLRWTRQAVPTGAPAQAISSPDLLIRALQLEGTAQLRGQAVQMRGLLTNFTTSPAHQREPIRLRITGTGCMPLELQATINRSGSQPRDELLVDCAQLALPQLRLGQADQLQLTLAPSDATLSISVGAAGDAVSGEVLLVHNKVRLAPSLGGQLSDSPVAASLAATLGELRSVATRVSLRGTLDNPQCTLWSNLGPAVAEAMDRSIEHAAEQHARTVLAAARRHVDERLADLDRQIATDQAKLAVQMSELTGQVEAIAATHSPHDRTQVERIGHRLPGTSLFR